MTGVRIFAGSLLGGTSAGTGFALWGWTGTFVCFGFTMAAWLAGLLWIAP